MKPAILAALGLATAGTSSAASLVGFWEFNNSSNVGQATIGADLGIVGTAPAHSATVADDASNSQSGVITTAVGIGNHLLASNPIGPNGGGSFTNQYTLLIDLFSPADSRNVYRSLYQTAPANNNDGDLFIHNSSNGIGVADIGYSPAVDHTVWNRYVITFDLGNSIISYLNGDPLFTHNAANANAQTDGRFSLESTFLFFADESNENNPLHIGTLAFWDGALSADQIQALGVAGSPVPEPGAALLLGLASLTFLGRRRAQ